MSMFSNDFGSNTLDDAGDFEASVAAKDAQADFDDYSEADDESGAMTVGDLIEALSDYDDKTRISIAYAHNGEIGYSDIMSVSKNSESVQLNELEYHNDS